MGVTKKSVKRSDERVPTGIPVFDKLIEGGFEQKSMNLLVGGSGSGKSVFSTQFLYEGLRKGEHVLYVTFEERKGEFYANMKRLGWDLEMYEKKGQFIFLEYTPEKVKLMLEEGGGAIETLIIKHAITRVVIDSITSFALLFERELEKREAALALFNMISGWNCTAILTYERDPTEGSAGIDHKALEFECDSIILFYSFRKQGERKGFLEVLKMRGTKHSKFVYEFSITDKGIAINPHPYKGKISRG